MQSCLKASTHINKQFKTVFIDGHFRNALGVCSPQLRSVAAWNMQCGTAGGDTFSLLFSAGSPETKGGRKLAKQGRETAQKILAHNVLLNVMEILL